MSLFSLFKTKPVANFEAAVEEPVRYDRSAGVASYSGAGELWRKTPFSAYLAGHESHAVYLRGGVPVILPSFAVDFALGCGEFRTLTEQLNRHAEIHAWSQLQVASLQSWLPKMIDAGLLTSAASFRTACERIRDPANQPARIGAICYPTGGNRVALLSRALSGFAANVRTYGRTVDFMVVDSSPRAEQRTLFQEKSRELSRAHGVKILYSGEEQKRRFAEALVKRSGCRPETVEFALFDPLGAGFSCGANRNAIQLQQIGQMFASMDDDVICELAPSPKTAAHLALFSYSDAYERWVYPDRKTALESVTFEQRDYLGEHEALLGRDLGELLPPDMTADQLDLSKVGDDFLRRVETGSARVRTTYTGYIGDPGFPTSLFLLYLHGKNRERLTESEKLYRAALASRNGLVVPGTRSVGDWSVAPGVAMGLDNRDILPPFFPVLHGEDVSFGAAAEQCIAGALSGHLPLAIHHDSASGKPTLMPGDLSLENRAAVFEFTQILRPLIASKGVAEHSDYTRPRIQAQQAGTRARMRALGRQLSELGDWPAEDFREMIRGTVLIHESGKMEHLEQILRNEDAPDYWRHDVQDFIDHTQEALTHPDFDIPYELKSHRSDDENRMLMQRLIASYGALLQEWPSMVDAATELRESGITPAIDIGKL